MDPLKVAPEPVLANEDWNKTPSGRISFQQAVDQVKPGQQVMIEEGLYANPVRITAKGTKDKPIFISGGQGNTALLKGRGTVAELPPGRPDFDAFAFLTLDGAEHVVIEKLAFLNCYPTAIRLRNVRHVTIRSCIFTGFSYGIAAGHRLEDDRTQFLTIDDCRAIQDPDGDLWSGRVSWHSIKRQAVAERDEAHRNGTFFTASNVRGDILIHKTNIAQGFNGLQFWNWRSDPKRNRNIFVNRCRFAYLRDNAVEPELRVDNLWVVSNSFHNVHAPLSMDYVGGERRYIFGNTFYNRRRPGEHHQANRGGTIYKFVKKEAYPGARFYSAFNKTLTRTHYVSKGTTRHWTHANNAISILREGPHTDPDRTVFGKAFASDVSMRFCGDVTDHPDAADVDFFSQTKTVDAPLFAPPVIRPEFMGSTDEWDGRLVLVGKGADQRSEDLTVAIDGDETVTVPPGQSLDAGTPVVLLEAFYQQSEGLWRYVKDDPRPDDRDDDC